MRYPKVKIIIRKDGSQMWFVVNPEKPSKEELKSIKQLQKSFEEVAQESDWFVICANEFEIIKS
jgi:hypothetical protein